MPEALLAAIVAVDEAAVYAALRGRSEAERAEAAQIIVPAVTHEGDFGWYVRSADGGLEWHERKGYYDGDREWRQAQVLLVAALGTATLKDLRAIGAWRLAFCHPVPAAEILLERRATWTNAFVAWFLRAETWQSTWPHVRPLIQAGLAQRPDDVSYLNGMIAASRREDSPEPRCSAATRTCSSTNSGNCWPSTPATTASPPLTPRTRSGRCHPRLAADGRIDRERPLDALLSALQSDLSAYRSTWHRRLWRDLKVSASERAARTDGL